MGTKMWYYDHSTPAEGGMRVVNIESGRSAVSDYYVRFTKDEEDLRSIFSLFEPVSIGYYDCNYGEGSEFHYQFVGRKVV
jgi:hypothetical protein